MKNNQFSLVRILHAAVLCLTVFLTAGGCVWFPSGTAAITSFSFLEADNPDALIADAVGLIDDTAGTISVTVPLGTDVSELVASFETGEGQWANARLLRQVSGKTKNDFSSPVEYQVFDGIFTGNTYTVTLSATETMAMGLKSGSFSYSLDFGSSEKNVYFILTNTSVDTDAETPVVSFSGSVSPGIGSRAASFPGGSAASRKDLTAASIPGGGSPGRPLAIPDLPALRDAELPAFERASGGFLRSLFPGPASSTPLASAVGVDDPDTLFDYDSETANIAATCRAAVTTETAFGNKTLLVWVADTCWHEYAGADKSAYPVTVEMVAAVADAFLKAELENDIYDWVTGVFGEEWGSEHSYTNLIPESDQIEILLYDIDGDGYDTDNQEGWTVGFFYPRDNYTADSWPSSNQRVMFYIDSVLLAVEDADDADELWSVSDYWPATVISTLAHEFQHMIQFYQKEVVCGSGDVDTWLNEMCSLVAEDLVADKLGVPGPRGVDPPDDYAGGAPGITEGRLAYYNYFNDEAVNYWYDEASGHPEYVFRSYAIAYAFGAYLARNFGGASLFRDIVQSEYVDHEAVEWAVEQQGCTLSFADLLQRWGAAVVLSGGTEAPSSMIYNSGASFDSTEGDIQYRLGSINLYNYSYGEYDGPYFWTSEDDGYVGYGYAASNAYYLEEAVSSGTWDFTLPEGFGVTVVITNF